MPKSSRSANPFAKKPAGGRPIATFLIGVTALWLVAEWLLFGLISRHIGWFLTILLSILKGGLGLFLLGFVLRRMQLNFRDILQSGEGRLRLAEPLLAIFGAILICLPGFVASLAGLALFSPSIRAWLLRRFGRQNSSDFIDLSSDDYREIKP